MFIRRRRRRPQEEKFEEVPMTPMIDVVFQLLIFFMLSMHFKEVEGKLLSQLPKDPGLKDAYRPLDLDELRIVICAGGDVATHLNDKGRHEQMSKPGEVCRVLVEKHEVGDVYKTEKHPDRRTHNRAIYRSLGARARELYDTLPVTGPPERRPRVILDADSEVPYEHIVGAVNACKEVRIEQIEFVANPRHRLRD